MSGVVVPPYITIVQFEVERPAHNCTAEGGYPFVVWVEREPSNKCPTGGAVYQIRIPDAGFEFSYQDDGKACPGWVCPCMGRFVE